MDNHLSQFIGRQCCLSCVQVFIKTVSIFFAPKNIDFKIILEVVHKGVGVAGVSRLSQTYMEINQEKEETRDFLLTSSSFSFVLAHPRWASPSRRERLLPLRVGENAWKGKVSWSKWLQAWRKSSWWMSCITSKAKVVLSVKTPKPLCRKVLTLEFETTTYVLKISHGLKYLLELESKLKAGSDGRKTGKKLVNKKAWDRKCDWHQMKGM